MILWNVDKDVLDLLIYAGMLVSIYQYLLVFVCIFWCLPFLFLAGEASAAKRSEAALNYIVFQGCLVWEQLWQSRVRLVLNYMLESVRKSVDIVIRVSQDIIN